MEQLITRTLKVSMIKIGSQRKIDLHHYNTTNYCPGVVYLFVQFIKAPTHLMRARSIDI